MTAQGERTEHNGDGSELPTCFCCDAPARLTESVGTDDGKPVCQFCLGGRCSSGYRPLSATQGTSSVEQDWDQLRSVAARLYGTLVHAGSSPVSAANDVLTVVDEICGGQSL